VNASESNILDRVFERIPPTGREIGGWTSKLAASQYRIFIRELQQAITQYGSGADVLDWGCGYGLQSLCMHEMGFNVTAAGMDPPDIHPEDSGNDLSYRFAKLDNPITLPFAEGTFDVALSMGVLEHVRETGGDELQSLTELARVLRPGGTLIVLHFPQKSGLVETILHRTSRSKTRHLHEFRYSKEDVRMMLETSELQLSLQRLWTYGLFPRNSVARVLGRASNQRRIVRLYDLIDDVVGSVFPKGCMNIGFTAQKNHRDTPEQK